MASRMHSTQESVVMPRKGIIFGIVIGHSLEWYDFMVFTSFSVTISHLFFPGHSLYESLLTTTATLGVAFIARPIGGVLLGLYADRRGRKAALTLAACLMTLSMMIITCAPTYAAIGIGAPMLIVVARLLQGLSAGGEFGSSTSLLVELARPARRGLHGSWQMTGQAIAILAATLIGALMNQLLAKSSIEQWGWRIPFAIGTLIGPVGFLLRRDLDTHRALSNVDVEHASEAVSLHVIIRTEWRALIRAIGVVIALPVSIYILLSYLPVYTTMELKLPVVDAFFALVVGCTLLAILAPLAGALSDYVGRKRLTIAALVGTLAIIYPLYAWLLESPSLTRMMLTQSAMSIGLAGYFGPYGALLAEMFPSRHRATCLSLAYNVSVTLFGGFAQVFVMWITHRTGSSLAPIYYVMCGLAVSLASVMTIGPKRVRALATEHEHVLAEGMALQESRR
ncbi:MFS transporter [Pararobbsia silviterrae]